jgi:LmbE family N-acetylglucosaminyl deacetylase
MRDETAGTGLFEAFCRGSAQEAGPIMLIAAHPDDEVCSAGSMLIRYRRAIHIVHVTDGSPRDPADARTAGFDTREAYARARRRELLDALSIAGIGPERSRSLDFIDQEAGRHLADAARGIAAILEDLAPGIVLCNPYEGGHPDHDAAAFAVHAALRLLEPCNPPFLIEFGSYHARNGEMEIFQFLPNGAEPACEVRLSPDEQRLKRAMVDCYETQRNTVRLFPLSPERYRPAPPYDFTSPPHEGKLFYENFSWGMTGREWREQAGAALDALGLRRSA